MGLAPPGDFSFLPSLSRKHSTHAHAPDEVVQLPSQTCVRLAKIICKDRCLPRHASCQDNM